MVLELGSGTGLLAIAASFCRPKEYHATDIPSIMTLLKANLELNAKAFREEETQVFLRRLFNDYVAASLACVRAVVLDVTKAATTNVEKKKEHPGPGRARSKKSTSDANYA